jgi:RNA polymerase sigma factor (sigma-70 family)
MAGLLQEPLQEVLIMGKILNRIALALAGLGLLTGSAAGADAPARLHDEIRNRIIDRFGVEEASPDAVRDALDSDPDFGLLLEYYLEKSLNGLRNSRHADEALQETLLKIWKGRPHIFLKPHDEVIKYFQTSARHNLYTELRKANTLKEKQGRQQVDLAEVPQTLTRDPAEEAADRDLYEALASHLDRTELDVLDAFLSGTPSQRRIAGELGLSRYTVSQAVARIKEVLQHLLPDIDIPQSRE